MSTVLCPQLVSLNPSACTSVSCRSSHTHSPAFCDPCKAVHAEAHASIHLASVGHRLRVDGPVRPVRCIVCSPLGTTPQPQFLFIGPEHYAVHARTSAHRAKVNQLPASATPLVRSKTKTDSGIGIGRPGEARFSLDRPYASRTSTFSSPPGSRNVTPTPGPGSRPVSSMSFSAGPGFGEIPPGPPPAVLEPNEYVLCVLCHTVLPVPPDAPTSARGSTDPKLRVASGGSDATVRGGYQEDDNETSISMVTTTDNDTEVRKSLVLANHQSEDKEHARRVKFPKFKAAYEKRVAKDAEREQQKLREAGQVEELRGPVEEREQLEAERVAEQTAADTSGLTMSPDQLSLSSLSASPSVAVLGLDEGPVFWHQHQHQQQRPDSDSESDPEEPEPERRYRYQDQDEAYIQRARAQTSSASTPSEKPRVHPPVKPRLAVRAQTQPQPAAYVHEHQNDLPITIPDHLLPFLSPMTPSTALPSATEAESQSPTSEYLHSLPIRTLSTPHRADFAPEQLPFVPDRLGAISERSNTIFTTSTTPERSIHERPNASPSTSSASRPYEPSPSPPPRLAFDDFGRVLKLGSTGWERERGLLYDDPEPRRPVEDSESEEEEEEEDRGRRGHREEEDKSDNESRTGRSASGSVGTVEVKRYALGRNGTIIPPKEPEPVRNTLASQPAFDRRASGSGAGPTRATTANAHSRRPSTLGPFRAETLIPQRSVSGSAVPSPGLGLTTNATRPVAPRKSTGEWAMLSGSSRASGSAEIVLPRPSSRQSGSSSRPGSRNETSRPSSRMHRFVRSPEELSAIGDQSDIGDGVYSGSQGQHGGSGFFGTTQLPDESTRSSPSEASALIRGFDSPPLDLTVGRPEMLSPHGTRFNGNGMSSNDSSPQKSVRSFDSSPARQYTSPPTTARPFASPRSRQFASPTSSRPFSPTQAWKGLTPHSPRSSSSISDVRSPSLSSAGGEGESEFVGERKSFDEQAFLSDLGFGTPKSATGPSESVAGASEEVEQVESRASSPEPEPVPAPIVAPAPAPAPTARPRVSFPPPRVSSPLTRTIPVRVAVSPAPESPRLSKGKTRRRARPMGTSSVVGSTYSESAVGHGRRDSIGGESAVGSVAPSWYGGDADSDAGTESVVSRPPVEPIVSKPAPKPATSKVRRWSFSSESEAPAPHPGPSRTVAFAEPVVIGSASAIPYKRTRDKDSIISTSSEAPSSVVSPISPKLAAAIKASGLDVEMHEEDEEVGAVAETLAGMNLGQTPPTSRDRRSPIPLDEGDRIVTVERVDSDSGSNSPIVPEGAPSSVGSLFSRVVSPKPGPARARLGAVRITKKPTPAPPTSPPKTPAAQSSRSLRSRKQQIGRPDSAVSAARVPAPASVISNSSDVVPESIFSSGANRRRSMNPSQMPVPRSLFSRGPASVMSADSDASKEPVGLLSRLKASEARMQKATHNMPSTSRISRSHRHSAPAAPASPESKTTSSRAKSTTKKPVDDGLEGGLTSSEEEEDADDGGDDDARTTTADDDGLDHLTESVDEPFGLQVDAIPEQLPVLGQPANPMSYSPNDQIPILESLEHPNPTSSKLPEGFDAEFIDQPDIYSPMLVPPVGLPEDEPPMPEEVLALNPVICEACYAPMPLAKWEEHISKANHRRNAARYAQQVFEQSNPSSQANSQSSSRDDSTLDARERWAKASRLQPRHARPSEYAFCDICAVFLLRGDAEHFQGKKHYRCVRAAALNDADELESVRGSVSDEEDGPSARAMRAAAAAAAAASQSSPKTPTSTRLGQQAFQRTEASPKQHQVEQAAQSVDKNDVSWEM